MADSKISDLTEATAPADTDLLVIATEDTATKKITWATLKSKIRPNTRQVGIPLTVGDASGNAYPHLIAGTNVRHLVPAFVQDVDGFWYGILRIPQDYSSGPKIILRLAASNTAGSVTSVTVGTVVRDTAAGWDASAYTDETVQDITMSTTAYRPADATFTLSTTPAAGKDLLVRVKHNGTKTEDTLAVPTLLLNCVFEYTT